MAGTVTGAYLEKNNADLDITILQGKSVRFDIVYGGSSPVNVTGYKARLTARLDPNSKNYKVFLDETDGINVGGVNGVFQIDIDAADTALYDVFAGVYDLELETPSGFVFQLMSGAFRVAREVTR